MENALKDKLARGERALGLWCALASPTATEIVAGSGCDWILIDNEHAPNEIATTLPQLQAVAGYDVEPMVRLPGHDPVRIKQFLDIGARSLMIPNVNNADEARDLVAATRYPPEGFRGYSTSPRAARYGRIKGYHAGAAQAQLLVLQIENPEAVKNAGAIAAVDGVDCLFIGPSDLAVTYGHPGNAGADEVQGAIREVIDAAKEAGKPSGILAPNPDDAARYLSWGMTLVAVGSDAGFLTAGSDARIAQLS